MESRKVVLLELEAPSTDSVTDAWLTLQGSKATLRFDFYRDKRPFRSGIRFNGVAATKTRSERCCTRWHIAEAYDCLVEITNSTWTDNQIADLPEMYRSAFSIRHFMIYLDSAACLIGQPAPPLISP